MKYDIIDTFHDCKCAVYMRVSTKKQKSFGWQLEDCREFCEKRNITIVKEFREIISGIASPKERPVWLEAAKYCEENDISLLVASIDRLTRDVTFPFEFGAMDERGDFDINILVPQEIDKYGYIEIEKLAFCMIMCYDSVKHLLTERSKKYIEKIKHGHAEEF